MERIAIIIVAGGCGTRCSGGSLPKQFRLLSGMPILARTINNFAAALPSAQRIVVLPAKYIPFWENLAARFEVATHKVVAGGEERFHSVQLGLAVVAEDVELIAIQDGVRPLASGEMIRHVTAAAAAHGAAIPVVLPTDSLREVEAEGGSHPLDRSSLRIVQTPQVFRAEILRSAYAVAFDSTFTDDASVVERAGQPIFLAQGEASNLKITTNDDFAIAEALIALREAPADEEEEPLPSGEIENTDHEEHL